MSASDNLRGAAFMTLTMVLFTLGDVLTKLVLEEVPLFHYLTVRGAMVIVMLFALAWHQGALRVSIPRRDWGLLLLRGTAEAIAAYFFLTALHLMDLANATAVLQVLPLSLALSAAILFREPLGWRRLLAILVGFCGMLLIVRPGTAGFEPESLYALAAVACVTVRDLAVRRMSAKVPALMGALIMAVSVFVFSAAFATQIPWEPLSALAWQWIILAAVLLAAAYLVLVLSMRYGEISFVAPFRYTGLVFALIFGFLVFGDWPDHLTLLGAAIVICTGIFTLYRESLAKRQAKARRT